MAHGKQTSRLKKQGTYREDRHGHRAEFQCDGKPERMFALDGHAAEFWDFVNRTMPEGMLSMADSAVLTAVCQQYSVWRRETADYENTRDDKAFSRAMRAFKNVMDGARSLGMTPVDRSKISKGAVGQKKKGGMADLLGNHLKNANN